MDVFVARCLMLPPPDPYASNPYQQRTVVTTRGCCGHSEQEPILVMVPNTTLERAQHQLRNRERVMHDHDVSVMTEKLQEEPTMEELEKDDTHVQESKLKAKDIMVGGITFLACVGVLLLLCLHHFPTTVSATRTRHA